MFLGDLNSASIRKESPDALLHDYPGGKALEGDQREENVDVRINYIREVVRTTECVGTRTCEDFPKSAEKTFRADSCSQFTTRATSFKGLEAGDSGRSLQTVFCHVELASQRQE